MGTALVEVFKCLLQHQLVGSAEAFSVEWCGKSKSWYAERKHAGKDFGVSAGVECYRAVEQKLEQMRRRRRRIGAVLDDEVAALEAARDIVQQHLMENHLIAAVSTSDELLSL